MNHNKSKAQNPKSKTKNNQFQFFYFISDKNFLCVWNIDILIIVFCSHKNNLKGVHELTMLLPSVVASLWSARSVVICKFQFRNLDFIQMKYTRFFFIWVICNLQFFAKVNHQFLAKLYHRLLYKFWWFCGSGKICIGGEFQQRRAGKARLYRLFPCLTGDVPKGSSLPAEAWSFIIKWSGLIHIFCFL